MTSVEQARIREQRKKGPLRLLVEGPDDMHTIIGLTSRHNISWDSAAITLPLSTLIPANDPCFSHAEEATKQARLLGAPLAEKDHMKGAIRTWLAWRAQPGVPFGTALTSKYLRHDSEEALRFLAWFKKLFLEPAEGG